MESTYEEAVQLRAQGQAGQAITIFAQLLEKDPNNAELLYQMACAHDNLGLEKQAVPYYVAALRNQLGESHRPGALLGLGSTYRTLGQYEDAKEILAQGVSEFPNHRELKVFYAMALYNVGEHAEAMKLLLTELVDTTNDAGIASFEKAIRFYADKLDQIWDE
ncbi:MULTISPECIES: tetratricopeptide repeat protein [Paenibacillus]|uniref:Tetratricopeptide repeat protein n=1 Tax=Paenibacillus suaedae TaxID=3077233 RepID=A0AAJ2JYV0_9BACL|nr:MULTISPECIES: tetratricopeptide repeat protein [Paenibacillus]MDT8978872.1 tetratricopeptide repeat protein [Paenibacillus sp. chi10]GAV15522.1 TPR repeat-containing protein [Paenibacillus sp. NAIST15-1]